MSFVLIHLILLSYSNINLFNFPRPHTYHINAEGNFLAGNKDTDLSYNDISLAYLTIPKKLIDNGIDLPFKYDYTITPCMRFGKLTNLSVSNTIDFSNLHAFNKSQFTTWKYRIDGNQLKLTFGAEVFDTFETYKVDALVLEFYDLWGFAGSLEITNKKSYNGVFTKIISLNWFIPAFVNNYGVELKDARNYTLLGCQELEIPGKSNFGCEDGQLNLAKVLELTLNDGTKTPLTVASGIAKCYSPEDLIGKSVIVVANLAPRTLCGVESHGMILAGEITEDDIKVAFVDGLPAGTQLS